MEYKEVRSKIDPRLTARLATILDARDNLFALSELQKRVIDERRRLHRAGGPAPVDRLAPFDAPKRRSMSASMARKFDQSIANVFERYIRYDAVSLMKDAPYFLGVFPKNTGRKLNPKGESDFAYTAKNYFYHALYRGSRCDMHVLPCLDYLAFGSAEKLLGNMRSLSVLDTIYTRESGDPGYPDCVFAHLISGNVEGQTVWADRDWIATGSGYPPITRNICHIIASTIRGNVVAEKLLTFKDSNSYWDGLHAAVVGIYRRDVPITARGIEVMFRMHARIDNATWGNQTNWFMSIPTIALMRYARSRRVNIPIPDGMKEHEQLILCNAKERMDFTYCLYPGISAIRKARPSTTYEALFSKK